MKYKTNGGIELEGSPQEIAEYFYEKHKYEDKEIPLVPLPQQTIPEQVNQSKAYRSERLHNAYIARKKKDKADAEAKQEKADAEAKQEKKREYQRKWCAKQRAKKQENKKPKTILGMALKKYIASKSDLSLDSLDADLQAKGIKIKRKNLSIYIKEQLKKREISAQQAASTTETAPKNEVVEGIKSIFGGV